MAIYQENRPPYTISDDRSRIEIDRIHRLLNDTYWAKGVPREVVVRSVGNSLTFGIYHDTDGQVGLARVITDYATFAYISDVVIDAEHRGNGLSKWLMGMITAHPDLQYLRRWVLITSDAHGLYEQFGFTVTATPERYMERVFKNVYQQQSEETNNSQ